MERTRRLLQIEETVQRPFHLLDPHALPRCYVDHQGFDGDRIAAAQERAEEHPADFGYLTNAGRRSRIDQSRGGQFHFARKLLDSFTIHHR